MSESSPPRTSPNLALNISGWLRNSTSRLKFADVPSARLDAEIILAHTLGKPRTYLHAHGDEALDLRTIEISDARLQLRVDRVPVAYIVGHKEFYGRQFRVSTATLIPRPESEVMIELLTELVPRDHLPLLTEPLRLIDVGTGSGNLGLSAKLELPELDVALADLSQHALTVAEMNAKRLAADVTVLKSDLLESYAFRPDIILANLPYVDERWPRSPETNAEPASALFASDEGLALIKQLIIQASARQVAGGRLLLEADPSQHDAILSFAHQNGYQLERQQDYIIALIKT